MWLMQNGLQKPDNAGAASTDYMHLFGLVALGYMWARMAKVAQDKLANGGGTEPAQDQARDRQVLHGAHAAGNCGASRANSDRR